MEERKIDGLEQRLTDLSRRADQSGDLPTAIGALEVREVIKAASNSTGQVTLGGWGTFHKNENGTWVGAGGKYGPSTLLGKQLEAELSKQSSE